MSQHIPPVAQAAPSTSYAINAGVVLSRPPQITRDLHPFESAFFLYQRRLNERLALPFTRYFYFKKRTPADLEWKRKMKQRLTPARDIGRYQGYGDEAWNDELLVGSKESDFEWQVERLLEDAGTDGKAAGEVEQRGMKTVEREEFEKPMSRRTEADEKNDTKSLGRALQRTLYLLVKNKDGQWQFPQDRLNDKNLHGVSHCDLPSGIRLTVLTGSITHHHTVRRPKHEHLARRPCAHRPPPARVYQGRKTAIRYH